MEIKSPYASPFYTCYTVYNVLFTGIVLISVVGMAAANDLQSWIDRKFKRQTTYQEETYNAVKT